MMSASLLLLGKGGGVNGEGPGALAALAARQGCRCSACRIATSGSRPRLYRDCSSVYSRNCQSEAHPTPPPLPPGGNKQHATNQGKKNKSHLYLAPGILSPLFIASRKKCFWDTCSGSGAGGENKWVEPTPGIMVLSLTMVRHQRPL